MKSPTKSRLSPRSAKPVGPVPAVKGHTAPARAPKATKPGKPPRRSLKPARPQPTRGDEVIELLRRKNGASIAEMMVRFGIQAHSLRAVISVEIRKRGLKTEMPERGRYRIT